MKLTQNMDAVAVYELDHFSICMTYSSLLSIVADRFSTQTNSQQKIGEVGRPRILCSFGRRPAGRICTALHVALAIKLSVSALLPSLLGNCCKLSFTLWPWGVSVQCTRCPNEP